LTKREEAFVEEVKLMSERSPSLPRQHIELADFYATDVVMLSM
jgi:hypothetical protein